MQRCHIYKTAKEYIILTESKTEDWIWTNEGPIYRVLVENKDNKLIETVLEALKSSRLDIPNIPREDKPILEKKALKEMGQKSYTDLYRKSNSCSVSRDENGLIEISPYKPCTPGNFSSGLVVAKEGVVQVDMNVTSVPALESILIEILNQDYKS
jgi:hypothetical protein